MRRFQCRLLLCFLATLFLGSSSHAHPKTAAKPSSAVLPVTSSSAKARQFFEHATTDYIYFHLDRALEGWRAAVKADPRFALAYAFISFGSKDPGEEKSARRQANVLARRVTPGERLMIRWMTEVRENNYIAGIAAMNDLVARYPKDQRVVYLAGNWLLLQESFQPAERLLNRVITLDPSYPPPWNALGYLYAETGDFSNAVSHMERYVALRPSEANPHDSYAEVLRMSGDFDAALQHYQTALKISPGFSLLGVADTYALMGDQERARAGYEKGMKDSETEEDRFQCRMQFPVTYVREKKFAEADKAFLLLAEWARSSKQGSIEAQAHRMMAEYQPEDDAALKHLQKAESILAGAGISRSDRDEELARVLRWRVVRSLHSAARDQAQQTLQQLEAMASTSSSDRIQRSWHAAAGAMLVAGKNYNDAIPHLQEDPNDPFSVALLAQAYAGTGDAGQGKAVLSSLSRMNVPTLEQALVVPALRARQAGGQ